MAQDEQQDLFEIAFPEDLKRAEVTLLGGRREAVKQPRPHDQDRLPPDTVGVALSGGGIRSATFCLGLFQALADLKLVDRIDYLSTVSGGGYFGSFFRAAVARGADGKAPGISTVQQILSDRSAQSIDWLRENGRYLAPGGSGDDFAAWATYMRGWAAIQAVLVSLVLLLFSATGFIRSLAAVELQRFVATRLIWWSPYLLLPLIVLVLVTLPLGSAFWMVPRSKKEERTRSDRVAILLGPALGLILILSSAALAWIYLCPLCPHPDGTSSVLPVSIAATALFGVVALIAAVFALVAWTFVKGDGEHKRLAAGDPERDRLVRNRLTSWFVGSLWLVVGLLAFALIDSLGQTAYAWLMERCPNYAPAVAAGGGASGVLALMAKLSNVLGWSTTKDRVSMPLGIVAGIAAAIVVVVSLVSLCAVTHGFAWGWQVPVGRSWTAISKPKDSCPPPPNAWAHVVVDPSTQHAVVEPAKNHEPESGAERMCPWSIGAVLATMLLMSLLFGQNAKFLNASSLQSFYGARLTRAYLGASNEKRFDRKNPTGRRVTDAMKGDDLSLEDAAAWTKGGPLHIINVTVNETMSGETQVDQSDRKGVPLAIGPAGLSGGIRHHALWTDGATNEETRNIAPLAAPGGSFQMFGSGVQRRVEKADSAGAGEVLHPAHVVERLPLGAWTSISGAAFSTGLGARTSLGLSLLLGIANVRLGYWWDSHVDPRSRDGGRTTPVLSGQVGELLTWAFPVQSHLLQELTARFYGPQRQRWYLTDGGHFENTACYELIRRRVPFIVCCDDGEDPEYLFEDVANLVRKARTDFQAEIRILDRERVERVLPKPLWPLFGTPEEFRRARLESSRDKAKPADSSPPSDAAKPGSVRPHAMLAEVYFIDAPERLAADDADFGKPDALRKPDTFRKPDALIVFIKPSLGGDEPLDVATYHRVHEDFPQQPTVDQFFDDEQWESYRRLGEHIGHLVFRRPDGVGWWPNSMAKPESWPA